MIGLRLTQPATLHRYATGSKDAAGDVGTTFTDVPDPIYVELQQQDSREFRDGRIVQISTWTVFIRPDAEISHLDQLTVDGTRYSFLGKPWLVRHPRTGARTHWLGRLEEVS